MVFIKKSVKYIMRVKKKSRLSQDSVFMVKVESIFRCGVKNQGQDRLFVKIKIW